MPGEEVPSPQSMLTVQSLAGVLSCPSVATSPSNCPTVGSSPRPEFEEIAAWLVPRERRIRELIVPAAVWAVQRVSAGERFPNGLSDWKLVAFNQAGG